MPTIAKEIRVNVRALGDVPHQLATLDAKPLRELHALHLELVGEPTRSRNRRNLIKKLAWYIQARAEGGLSSMAIERVAQLGDRLPERWIMRQVAAAPSEQPVVPRDPRVPPVGSVLRRIHAGTMHEVTVRADGFEYSGRTFKTLSSVATHIAGTSWSGFAFFGLNQRSKATSERVA